MSIESAYRDLMVDRYPFMGKSQYLFDYFAILGYDYEYIRTFFVDSIKEKFKDKASLDYDKVYNLYQFTSPSRPTIQSSVPNMNAEDFDTFEENSIAFQMFPDDPIIYFNPNKTDSDILPSNIISLKADEATKCHYSYGYIFMRRLKRKGFIFMFPKFFFLYPIILFYDFPKCSYANSLTFSS